ncbi:MAG: leucine--tRNA ligase [Planctomycetes bacterium]|nr:leucine--tRNA ligase [Planctomycetota bacterium]NOG55729.1 leucine--tRNA ligase [Planctomycetota bacterium]
MSDDTAPPTTTTSHSTQPAYRYDAPLACALEEKWQDRWDADGLFCTPNPGQPGFDRFERAGMGKRFILDMFPYPSGAGLHVGHPLGYIATDIYSRYLRAKGYHVLHTMGFDAFGLPAEQYAVDRGVHPRVTTEQNVTKMQEQLRRLGLAHDPGRSVHTTDPEYYKWTQWIFLQIYNSWYDGTRARPIAELVSEYESGARPARHDEHNPDDTAWADLTDDQQRAIIDSHRLAYLAEVPVNWCPGLGTVLANEEVTAEGRSDRGNFPVYKRPLKQWMMRISTYAERLLANLERVDWPEPIKLMQRNWIGRSEGAYADFLAIEPGAGADVADKWYTQRRNDGWRDGKAPEPTAIRVYTTRPDTLFGATYVVLAPEHPLVDSLTADAWPTDTPDQWKGCFPGQEKIGDSPKEMAAAYRRFAESKSDVERQVEEKTKTGVFLGSYAINPVNGERLPIFIADYVLMGYGTGAIMCVPGHDERDFAFAQQFGLPILPVVMPDNEWIGQHTPALGGDIKSRRKAIAQADGTAYPSLVDAAYTEIGQAINSANDEISLNGTPTPEAKDAISEWLYSVGLGRAAVNYKLRDWLFSRQRYWGEPFPIVYDENGNPHAVDESELPVRLPELDDFSPAASDDPNAMPEPPLARANDWVTFERDGKTWRRETNTMPQWAGSCWYYLRYLDPENHECMVDPTVDEYWMKSNTNDTAWGGVDLYVGGAEHAVLHLLYARFWHKVLFDLGRVSTCEPFQRLFNQGMIQAYAYTDARGMYVPAEDVEERADGTFYYNDEPVKRLNGKMGKSLKNIVTPDDIFHEYGCDTLRLYEMYLGPLEQSKPWSTRDIVGSQRFLQRVWRNLVDEDTGALNVAADDEATPADEDLTRLLHKTIDKVDRDMNRLAFNTAIAALIEFNNALVQRDGPVPRDVAEPMIIMLAPFVPHMAEELWEKLGHDCSGYHSVMYAPFPTADPKYLVVDEVELVVQVLGKVRGRVMVPPDADEETAREAAMSDANVQKHLEGKTIRKVIFVPGRLINFVAN